MATATNITKMLFHLHLISYLKVHNLIFIVLLISPQSIDKIITTIYRLSWFHPYSAMSHFFSENVGKKDVLNRILFEKSVNATY